MRLWVHKIWRDATGGRVLQTAGPKEDRKFEDFLHQHGDAKAAYAWWLYCNAEPAPYNLEAVKHVDEFTSKNGNRIVLEKENQAAITRFPLSAFLAVAEGYLVNASFEIDEVQATPNEQRTSHFWNVHAGLASALEAIKCKTPSLKSEW
jgi:hypothetical protein